ncbi:polysaccharide deacetylase family protein [Streptomyces sp. A7024]|uniref:Polysaccharide deacetylase family protein n=1 Tax=Streptomyces coryli TaxID=1128680 RepID=A0A6G4U430_9ACTN|nr:polysaccharide deacetylase family protein [Streptomyces coryli]
MLKKIATSRKVIALTFDASTHPDSASAHPDGARRIIATLKEKKVPATFFLTGQFARVHPDIAREMAAAGFAIGNHSDTHPFFGSLPPWAARHEVKAADRSIAAATGLSTTRPLFRFPYGRATPAKLRLVDGLGYTPIGWAVDTEGWRGAACGSGRKAVIARVLQRPEPGQIILMHIGSGWDPTSTPDADALPAVIDRLRKEGYSFTELPALP